MIKEKTICRLCGNKFENYEYRAKAAAIKLLGGKCQKCGWHGNQAALQFHHKNTKEKDFIIGSVANKSWDSIKNEMQKCILLCANCHMIEHSTKNDEKFMKEALNYKGRTLKF